MPTLKEIHESGLSLEAFFARRATKPDEIFELCSNGCGAQLGRHPQPSSKGPVCEDCYYDLLGEFVEEHPIVSVRIGHGCVAGD